MTPLVVAVDGPSGSGKSTVARALADRLELAHVDTGAYYRGLTLAVLRAGVDPSDPAGCAALAERLAVTVVDGRTHLDGQDVEADIRGAPVTAAVSTVSSHPAVRRALVARQRAAVGPHGAVVEGRDAGTVVVPDAELKVWLTAAPDVRAARRAAQLGERDPTTTAADLARRDDADAAQMARAADAEMVDTTDRGVDDIVAELAERATAVARGRP